MSSRLIGVSSVHEGSIHSIYIKLDNEDYSKIYNYYNYNNMLDNQTYLMYSNNSIGVLFYKDNLTYKNVAEKWKFVRSSVYNYKNVDVAYVIDKFELKRTVPSKMFNNISIRLNSYGNWCNLDSKLAMFIGRRIIYKNHNKNLQFLSENDREVNQCVNYGHESAVVPNPFVIMDTYEDLYVLFRSINHKNFLFNKKDIKNFLCNQKLEHMISKKNNLIIPLQPPNQPC